MCHVMPCTMKRNSVFEDGEGINVRTQFSQHDKNGKIRANVTLRPSFLMDSVPTSSLELFITQVVPWDVD